MLIKKAPLIERGFVIQALTVIKLEALLLYLQRFLL